MPCLGNVKIWRCFAAGVRVTRHPERELHSNLGVAARELVESRAAKEKIPAPVAVRQPQVNGRELVDSFRRIAHHRRTVKFLPWLSVEPVSGGMLYAPKLSTRLKRKR